MGPLTRAQGTSLRERILASVNVRWQIFLLICLPFLVHAPVLVGWLIADPVYFFSGLIVSSSDRIIPGLPGWNDPNTGTTTQALGSLAAQLWLSGEIPWWNPYNGAG